MVENSEVARVLYEIASYLELLEEIPFKPKAYQKAARNIEQLHGRIEDYCSDGRLNEIPGIGKAIAEKITELITKGKMEYLEKLRSQIPIGVIELMKIPDIGPKTAMLLYRELSVDSVESLKEAIFAHRLSGLRDWARRPRTRSSRGSGSSRAREAGFF